MTHILTAGGRTVHLRHIELESIDIGDIAHALAQLNRFTGHAVRPYSVAEHSLLVLQLLEHAGETSPAVLLAGLLHDAHKAYTSDLSSPAKTLVGSPWHAFEKAAQHHTLLRFGVATAFNSATRRIHYADMRALSTERLQLMPPDGPIWPCTVDYPAADFIDLRMNDLLPWTHWRDRLLERFDELTFALAQEHQRLGRKAA